MAATTITLGEGFQLIVSPESDKIGIENWETLMRFLVHAKTKFDKAAADGKITWLERLRLAGLSEDLLQIIKRGKLLVAEAESFTEEEYKRLYVILDVGFEFNGKVDELFASLLAILRSFSGLADKIEPSVEA